MDWALRLIFRWLPYLQESANTMRLTLIIFLVIAYAYSQEIEQNDSIGVPTGIVVPEEVMKKLSKGLLQEMREEKTFRQFNKKKRLFESKSFEYTPKTINAQKEFDLNQIEGFLEFQQARPDLQEDVQEESVFGSRPEKKDGQEVPISNPDESATTENGDGGPTLKAIVIPNTDLERNRARIRGPSQYDSRIEVRRLDPKIYWQFFVLNRTQSVGMVVEKRRLRRVSDSIYQFIIPKKLGDYLNLCDNEPFQEQPALGVGTAFVVDDRTMLTARHVFAKSLDKYAIVFGFEVANDLTGVVETVVHARDVHFPVRLVHESRTYDTSLVALDRPVGEVPLKWENSRNLKNGTEIYMIGHPLGLPKKIALNADIIDNSHPQYFYTSLDSFQGNSGSPVFHFETHRVIGILVSGQLDFKFNGNCYESNVCDSKNCKGEKVIRIENILNKTNRQ